VASANPAQDSQPNHTGVVALVFIATKPLLHVYPIYKTLPAIELIEQVKIPVVEPPPVTLATGVLKLVLRALHEVQVEAADKKYP